MITNIKYRHALDSDGNIINISAVTEADRNKEFRCLGCGELMRPRLGTKNTHHFAHKNDVFNCSPETYIHKLAKQKIKEWFDNDEPFRIGYYNEISCSKTAICTQYAAHNCPEQVFLTANLKEQYNTCELESRVEESGKVVIPDILLTGHGEQPMFIEICVSHPCEQEKINLGFRIIEINIRTEEDIDNLHKLNIIKESDMVRFYNFDRIVHNPQSYPKEECLYTIAKREIKNWLNSNREFNIGFYRDTLCIDSTNCVFYQVMNCKESYLESYNLKLFYDTYKTSPVEQGAISDLRLLSKDNPNRRTIDILIQTPFFLVPDVNYQKLVAESYNNLIILDISSKEALNGLLNFSEIKEGKTYLDNLNSIEAKFYGFKKRAKRLNRTDIFRKVYLYQSGKVFIKNWIQEDCRKIKDRKNSKAILEIVILEDVDTYIEYGETGIVELSNYEIIYAIAHELKMNIKNCIFCKYWEKQREVNDRPDHCKIDGKAHSKGNDAMVCKFYTSADDRLEETLKVIHGGPIEIIKT